MLVLSFNNISKIKGPINKVHCMEQHTDIDPSNDHVITVVALLFALYSGVCYDSESDLYIEIAKALKIVNFRRSVPIMSREFVDAILIISPVLEKKQNYPFHGNEKEEDIIIDHLNMALSMCHGNDFCKIRKYLAIIFKEYNTEHRVWAFCVMQY